MREKSYRDFRERFAFLSQRSWRESDLSKFNLDRIDGDRYECDVIDLSTFRNPISLFFFLRRKEFNFVVTGFKLTFDTWPYFLVLSLLRIRYGFLINASQPQSGTNIHIASQNSRSRWNYFLRNFSFKRLANAVVRRVPSSVLGLKPARFIVVDGEKGEKIAFSICHPNRVGFTSILKAHSLDYERAMLGDGSCQYYEGKPYAVFIDQAVDAHPDFKVNGIVSPVSELYEKSLTTFFDNFQKRFDLDVRIASHPKRNLSEKFAGRENTFGKTAELIRDSSLVLAHDSTAIAMAVLFHKKVVFLTTNELNLAWTRNSIHTYASALGQAPINIDTLNFDRFQIPKLDEQAYAQFYKNHIKIPGTPELHWWEIILNEIRGEVKASS